MRKYGLITALCLSLLIIFGTSGLATQEPLAALNTMELVAENEYLSLYLHPKTTEIAVYQRESGKIWFSNPQNWKDLESTARGSAKDQLGAQFIITYDRPDRRNREANNYSESVVEELFEIKELENGVRVEYRLGRPWKEDDFLPLMASQERFEELILEKVSASAARNFQQRYYLVYLREYKEGTRLEMPGMNMQRLLGDYEFVVVDDRAENWERQIQELRQDPSASEDDITRLENQLNSHKAQVLRDILELITKNRADLDGMDQIRLSHLEHMIDTPTYVLGRVPVFARTALIDAIRDETAYRPEDANEDRIANNLDPIQQNIETFFVPVEYYLDGQNFAVRIPMNEVEYPLDVVDNQGSTHTYPLHTISVLPYFGAAYQDQDGYIFMPDGSGALIHFDSPKYTLNYVGNPVYGRDLTGDSSDQILVNPEQTYLPVYGMKVEDTAFLAIVERGDALARFNAAKAGFVNSFHAVAPRFNVMPFTNLSLGPIGEVGVYQKRTYQGDIVIKYRLLTGPEANYAGMAQAYQDYLVETFALEPTTTDEDFALYLTVVGNIVRNEPVLGVPRETVRSLTTFQQTEEIVDRLLQEDVTNLKVRYSGWLKGGPEHIFPTKVQVEKGAGGKTSFEELSKSLENKGVEFFPQVNFLLVNSKTFDGFNPRKDGAQFFNNRPKLMRVYDVAFGKGEDTETYLLSPKSLGRVVDQFLKDYSAYGVSGLALNDLGKYVNSDFRNKVDALVDRQQAAEFIEEELAKIQDSGYSLLVEGANGLTLPYASHILGVPRGNSNHEIFDEAVPFYQLAVQGLLQYGGTPLNLASDYQKALLHSIALGSGLHYQWAYENTDLISNSAYNSWYAVRYSDWIDRAVRDYRLAKEIRRPLQGGRIIEHIKIDDNRFLTIYDNGYSIGVDYSEYTLTVYSETGEPMVYQF